MALYTIGDLHLSESSGKSPWMCSGACGRITGARSSEAFSPDTDGGPTTVRCCAATCPGALRPGAGALADLRLVDSFPGKKILLKGNHDLWWQTVTKMNKFFENHRIQTLSFLHNNCIFYRGHRLVRHPGLVL